MDLTHQQQTCPLIDYKEAARRLGLKLGTLYAMVHQGRVPHVRLGARLVRFDAGELSSWIAQHRIATPECNCAKAENTRG